MSERTNDLIGFWTSVVRAATLIPAKVPLGGCRRIAEDEVTSRLKDYGNRLRQGETAGLFAKRDLWSN